MIVNVPPLSPGCAASGHGDRDLARGSDCGLWGGRPGGALGLRGVVEDGEDRDPEHGCEDDAGRVRQPPPPGAAPRLLDQRLDEGLELVAVDRIARARRAGRGGGDGHWAWRLT